MREARLTAIADQRVREALAAADVAGQHRAGVDADAVAERRLARALAARVPRGEPRPHVQRRAHRLLGVVRLGDRRAEHRLDLVADVLEHQAAVVRGWRPPSRRSSALRSRTTSRRVLASTHGVKSRRSANRMVTSRCWPSSATRPARISSRTSGQTYLPKISRHALALRSPWTIRLKPSATSPISSLRDHRAPGVSRPCSTSAMRAGQGAQRLRHAARHRDRQPHGGGDAHRHHEDDENETSSERARRAARPRPRATRARIGHHPEHRHGQDADQEEDDEQPRAHGRRGAPGTREGHPPERRREGRGAIAARRRGRRRTRPRAGHTVVPKIARRARASEGPPSSRADHPPDDTRERPAHSVIPPRRKGTHSARRRISGGRRAVPG